MMADPADVVLSDARQGCEYTLPLAEYESAGIDINANEYTILVHFRGTW